MNTSSFANKQINNFNPLPIKALNKIVSLIQMFYNHYDKILKAKIRRNSKMQ